MVFCNRIKKFFAEVQPQAERLAVDTAKGYVFGCLVGVFVPSKQPLLRAAHENGKNFAKMSAAYSATEMALSYARGKDDPYNSLVSGAVAGGVGSRHGLPAGAAIFGAYSGTMHYFAK
ncbi:mitochondrial import inner membrane translocase subunit TIM22 [Pancytospora philotis]|nr:mitochondrial import inner membrane translocase subunit TIM22 [Pancytospora philotis]